MANMLYGREKRGTVKFDPLHRLWCALYTGVKCAGSYDVTVLGTILANGDRAPFGTKENLNRFRAHCTEFLAQCQEDIVMGAIGGGGGWEKLRNIGICERFCLTVGNKGELADFV